MKRCEESRKFLCFKDKSRNFLLLACSFFRAFLTYRVRSVNFVEKPSFFFFKVEYDGAVSTSENVISSGNSLPNHTRNLGGPKFLTDLNSDNGQTTVQFFLGGLKASSQNLKVSGFGNNLPCTELRDSCTELIV